MIAPQVQLCSDDFGNFLRLAGSAVNVLVSPKLDGFRCVIPYGVQQPEHWSRNGLCFDLDTAFFSELYDVAHKFEEADRVILFDGEITHPGGLEAVRDIVLGGDIPRRDELFFNIFDICLPDIPLLTRTEILADAFIHIAPGSVRLVEHEPLKGELTEENLDRYRDRFVREGFEGAVFKVADAVYLPGLSPYWLRRVPFQSVDLPVVCVGEGAGQVIRALVCDHYGVDVRVTAGLTAVQKKEFYTDCPAMVEVFHRGVTRGGSLRNPVFRRTRPDKVHAGS